jgi:hypothetical protein
MTGETNISVLIKNLTPTLKKGEYVFCTLKDTDKVTREDTICEFKEYEGLSIVIERQKADQLKLKYDFVLSWITLIIHSSLEAVGLTAIVATELAKHDISCNIIAGYYHDHIFVNKSDANKTLQALIDLSKNY